MSNADMVFSALADESRRRILVMLTKESMHVNAIAENFDISRPAISKHLRILVDSKLVKRAREGREQYYTINPPQMKVIYDWLKYFDKFWDDKLNSLKLFIEQGKGK